MVRRGLDFLARCPHWYMDGTFDTLPPQFMQLYTVHGINNGRNVIGAYAMLTNKQEVTYERVQRHTQFLTGNSSPATISTDFERAAINACRTEFPITGLSRCFFHLSQNIYRKVQENHLSILYQDDDIFRENIRMIGAIAFVPFPDIIMAIGALCVHYGANGNERVILRYFERNYISDLSAGVRAVPFSLMNYGVSIFGRLMACLGRRTRLKPVICLLNKVWGYVMQQFGNL